jgi:ATP adenylyltransferase
MDWLWSPWRFRYVTKASPQDACFFCVNSQAARDDENLIVYRGQRNFVLLNIFPYTSGHLMIAPYAHVASLMDIDAETANELMSLTRHAERNLRAVYRPQGLNVGMNLGECAGAGVAGHIHMHVLPRWVGDSSFMTTVSETRVVPEDLGDTLRKLKAQPW